jgi:acyl-coenzyme A thioesterase PaaI-like protein
VTPKTHLKIDPHLVGTPLDLGEGSASAVLVTTPEMAADESGLIHGGFVFGLADYAAMLAVNDPNVVLGTADTRFLKPVRVGEGLEARARIEETDGRKSKVQVQVLRDGNIGDLVMTGTFTCFTLDRHVLDREEERR